MMSRRVVRIGGVLLAATMLAAACSADDGQSGNADGTDSTEAGGGNLESVTIAMSEEFERIDPNMIEGQFFAVITNVVESLVDIDPESGDLVPKLATSWEQVDPTTWRFELREGVEFSNGEPFNAEAAAFGITRATDPNGEYSETVLALISLQGVKATAVDEHTLELTTSVPAPTLPREMPLIRLPAPEATGDRTNVVVGTGPYTVEEFAPSERLVFERNESYWAEKPEVASVTVVFRSESGVRRAMLDTGEADIAALNPADIDGIDTVDTLVSQTILVQPDLVCPVTEDVRVRKAMNLAIDRQGIAEELYGGIVEPASQIIHPQIAGHAESLDAAPYDPEAARELIEEAAADGVPVDQTLRLVTRPGYFLNSAELTELVAVQLNEIGLNVAVETVERQRHVDEIIKQDVPTDRCMVFMATPTSRTFDVTPSVSSYYTSEGAISKLNDSQVDDMFAEANALTDEEERAAAFEAIIEYVNEELVVDVPVIVMAEVFGLGPGINFEPRSDGRIDFTQIGLR